MKSTREVIARALFARASGASSAWDAVHASRHDYWLDQADAILSALRQEGQVVVPVESVADTERLDWLDTVNIRANERNGTVYGWKYDINHNRACLSDHYLPALTVREAIDAARFPGQAMEITLRSHREQKRRADLRALSIRDDGREG